MSIRLASSLTLLAVPFKLCTSVPHGIQHRDWSERTSVAIMELQVQPRSLRLCHTSSNARSISQLIHPLSRSSPVPGLPTSRPLEFGHNSRLCFSLRKCDFKSGLWMNAWRMAFRKQVCDRLRSGRKPHKSAYRPVMCLEPGLTSTWSRCTAIYRPARPGRVRRPSLDTCRRLVSARIRLFLHTQPDHPGPLLKLIRIDHIIA